MTFLHSLNIMQCWGLSRTPLIKCFPDIFLCYWGQGEETRQWSCAFAAMLELAALLATPVESCKQGIYHRETLWLLSAEKPEQVARGVLYCLAHWDEHGRNPFYLWGWHSTFLNVEILCFLRASICADELPLNFISFWLCLFCRNFYKRKNYCFVYAGLYIAGQDKRRADFKGQTGVSVRPFGGLGVLRQHRNNWSLRARACSTQIKALKIWALTWVGVRSVVILLINYSTLYELFDRRPESELMYSSHNPVLHCFRKSRYNAHIKLSPLLRVKAICQTG